MKLDLEAAQSMIAGALEWRKTQGLKPLTIAVLDSGGHLMALAREDGASNLRPRSIWGWARAPCSTALKRNLISFKQ